MLGEWREEGFVNPVVQDIRCPEFEYRVNEVIQGAKYRAIEDVKDAVKVWAISLRKEFRVLKSSSKEYEVRCADRDCACIQGKVQDTLGMFNCYTTYL